MEKVLETIITTLASEHAADVDASWLDEVMRQRNREVRSSTRYVAKKRLLPLYLCMREETPEVLEAWGAPAGSVVDTAVVRLLRTKPRRTASGVATITVLTKPWPCSGDCVFCPNDVRMPKSYLHAEPACQRAERCCFDPYLQVQTRLRVLRDMGHVTDKVELIVLGGTWSDYPRDYQIWFMTELFRALNEAGDNEACAERRALYKAYGISDDPDAIAAHVSEVQQQLNAGSITYYEAWKMLYGKGSTWERAAGMQHATLEQLECQQSANEQGAHRCVGLVVETRADAVNPEHLAFLRRLGCTKIQMGIQTLDYDVLARCGRATNPAQVSRALELFRLFGFKSHLHMMANLPGATPDSDAEEFHTLVTDARFMPDELKLYPCCLVEGARLERLYEQGVWQPYPEEDLVDLLVADTLTTPAQTRISRMIRDISATDIIAGSKKTNLRQEVEAHVRALIDAGQATCNEMRFREIGVDEVDPYDLHLETISYETTVSEERFLQWVTSEGRLAGFLRLSLPRTEALQEVAQEWAGFPLQIGQAMIREVHVYGKVAALDGMLELQKAPTDPVHAAHSAGQTEGTQHVGLGRQLVEEACRQAAVAGYEAIHVISAIGTRDYYRALGFKDDDLYQSKPLDSVR